MSGLGVTHDKPSPLQSRPFFRETKGVETSPYYGILLTYYWHSLARFAILLCSVFQDSHTCALSWPTKSAAVSVNPCQRCTVADHMQDISRSPAMSRQHIAVPCSLWHLTNTSSSPSSSSSSSVTSCCSTHPLCQLWSIHGAFILTAAVNLPNLDNILLLAVSFWSSNLPNLDRG